MAFVKKDILEHLAEGRSIYCDGGYFALLDGGYTVKCSNRSMSALLRDGTVEMDGNSVRLNELKHKLQDLTKENK